MLGRLGYGGQVDEAVMTARLLLEHAWLLPQQPNNKLSIASPTEGIAHGNTQPREYRYVTGSKVPPLHIAPAVSPAVCRTYVNPQYSAC